MAKLNIKISPSASPRLEPYPFQKLAINVGLKGWRQKQNTLLSLATGAGKSLICGEIAGAVATFGARSLIITPNSDLLLQDYGAFQRQFPSVEASLCCSKIGHRDTSARVVFATPGSIVRKSLPEFSLIIIDEAHRLGSRASSMLQKICAEAKKNNPNLTVIGLTATPFRLDDGPLADGNIWAQIDFEIGYVELLKLGILAPLVGPLDASPAYEMDLQGLRKSCGDFSEKDLITRFDKSDVTNSIANDLCRFGANRKSWLIFCVGVGAAEKMANSLKDRGVAAAFVSGETPVLERIAILDAFRKGQLRALVNVEVAREGFNAEGVDLVGLCRPTMSAALHCQQIGRGARKSPGKRDCLILDFAQNIKRLGPINALNIQCTGPAKEPTHRQCASCGFFSAPRAKTCESCDAEFPVVARPKSEKSLQLKADRNASPVTGQEIRKIPPNAFRVTNWRFAVHRKVGSPDSLRIEYFVQGYRFKSTSQWIAAWHPKGWGGRSAWADLLREGASRILPRNAQDACELAPSLLKRPDYIRIVDDGGVARVIPVASSAATGLSR